VTKIINVETISFPMASSWLTETEVANPMSIYPQYRAKRSSWMNPMTSVFVKVSADSGEVGYGWAGGGKESAALLVDKVFANLVIGKDVYDIEYIWDVLYRASVPYGRRGTVIEAISAIDVALWDVLGKVTGLPVYKLLGGKVRDRIPIYATGNATERHKQMGFKSKKLAMPCGPLDGIDGIKQNCALVRETRELLGPDGEIMLDCYMGWSEDYTVQMARRIQEYDIKWIEEPLLPEFYDGYRRLRDILNPMGILITGGEHEFTRFGFREMIEKRCVNILQPDIARCGGITEFKKICALASAYDMMVIPHGSGAPTYHAAINSTVTPFAEYIDINLDGGAPNFVGEPEPVNGYISLEDKPGFGYEINPLLFEGKNPLPVW
jgi:L-rhamnonate dehydratase